MPEGEEQYGAIDGYRIKEWVHDIVAISERSRDEGDPYWGRVAGTKYDRVVIDWLAASSRSSKSITRLRRGPSLSCARTGGGAIKMGRTSKAHRASTTVERRDGMSFTPVSATQRRVGTLAVYL